MDYRLWPKRGFTLIEIMVVVAIIGIVMGVAIPSVSMYRRRTKEAKARTDIESLGIAIKMYQVDKGNYPSDASLSGLVTALETDEYMEFKADEIVSGEFVDPWKKPYQYSAPGTNNTASFDIYSYGNDEEDDNGADDDINNW